MQKAAHETGLVPDVEEQKEGKRPGCVESQAVLQGKVFGRRRDPIQARAAGRVYFLVARYRASASRAFPSHELTVPLYTANFGL